MNGSPPSETVVGTGDVDFLQELSEYLDVLSSSVRLKILKLIERKPKDARTISREIETSYENTKKHLDRLLSIGLIRKEAGVGKPTSKGVHPVWEYSLVPGALEAVTRNLALFSNTSLASDNHLLSQKLSEVREKVSAEFGAIPALIVMGGPDDGRVFFIRKRVTLLGRNDPAFQGAGQDDILFSEEYRAVSRVSKPHARILETDGRYAIEDRGSTSGTYVNGQRLMPDEKKTLLDGAMIDLAKGPQSVRMMLVMPLQKGVPQGGEGTPSTTREV